MHILTQVDSNLVAALWELRAVVPSPQLREGWETRRAHPVLEVLVSPQVGRRRTVRVSIRETFCPVRRRHDFRKLVVGGGRIFLGLAGPCYTVL